MKSLKQQGIQAFVWDFLGKLARRGMGLVISIFLARLLEPADFGSVALIMIVFGIITVFTDVGLTGALIQRRRVLDIHYSSVFYFSLTMGSFFILAVFSIAPFFSEFYNNEILENLMKVYSIGFIISALGSVQSTKFRKEMNYAILTKIGLLSSMIGGVTGILMAYLGAGVWSLVVSNMLSGVIYTLYLYYKSDWKPSFTFSFKALQQLWGFGFRIFLASVINNVFLRVDYMIIGKIFPISTLGFLERAKSLNQVAIQLSSGSLMSVLFPLLSKIKNDLERFQKIIIKSLNVIVFLSCFLLGVLYLNSESIILLMFGEKWMPATEYFKIMALASLALPVGALLGNILNSRGDSKAYLRLEIYKKLLMSTDFVVLLYFGIMIFLYYRVLTSFGTIYMQVHFASREIKLKKSVLVSPIVVQVSIGIASVLLVIAFNKETAFGYISAFLIQTIEYLICFLAINAILRTDAIKYIFHELMSIYNKKFKKVINK